MRWRMKEMFVRVRTPILGIANPIPFRPAVFACFDPMFVFQVSYCFSIPVFNFKHNNDHERHSI